MRSRRIAAFVALLALVVAPGARAFSSGSRVIVSATLNDSLEFFDASTLAQTQPPLPSRGLGPVRMAVDGTTLYSANHGAPLASAGSFDLSSGLVTEQTQSPSPTGAAGAVGIAVSEDIVWVTNTTFALGGCNMPAGTVTAFRRTPTPLGDVLVPAGSVTLSGSIPYGIAATGNTAFATSNCANTVDTITLDDAGLHLIQTRSTGASPDTALWDDARGLLYVANIGGDSVSVFDFASPSALTTVHLGAKSGPVDMTLAGGGWLLTGNSGTGALSVLDRDAIAACAAAGTTDCSSAIVSTIATGVPGGSPEGIAYDAATNRAFVVNKYPLGSPSLSAIQLSADGTSGAPVAGSPIPLEALGEGTPVPALIAFDVVVQDVAARSSFG